MPELPEVQVVINFLKSKILNQNINNVKVLMNKILKNSNVDEFKNTLLNQQIKDIKRKGKYLLFYLSNDHIMVVHLRMEGKFFIIDKLDESLSKHTMVYFEFKDFILVYHDTRRFGTIHIIKQNELDSFDVLTKVEIDPLSEQFNKEFLYSKIKNKSQCIKTTLLDQSIVSGIGNIYVDEILFACKIHPLSKSNKLTKSDCDLICKYSKEILLNSINHNGTTVHSFRFNGIDSGGYQNYLKVHSTKIKQCQKCYNLIEFIKVNGRGTFLCNKCQKLKT